MIEFRHVKFSRGKKIILRDVTFSIDFTEKVAVLGGSGEGKTTLLKLIMHLLVPDSGQILIDQIDITQLSEQELRNIRRKFGLVFQDGALFDSLTVKENVAFHFREFTKLTEPEIESRVRTLLRYVGVEEALNMMPEELSGGMQRRVALARTLASEQPLMFLYDEPTSDLDPINALRIRNLIHDLNGNQRGFIIVTHEMHDALKLAERFIFLKGGYILFDGNYQALLRSDVSDLKVFLDELNRD
jgi:phospholipid/cholesterol/gamma-HCH transport system ATP-binding protein